MSNMHIAFSESAHPEPNRVPGLPNPIHATSGQFSLPGNTGPYPGYTPSGGTAHLASQHKRAKPSMVGFVYDQKTGQPTPIVLQQEPPSVVQQNVSMFIMVKLKLYMYMQ